MTAVGFARLFAMSAFEGLRALRLRRASYPELDSPGLADLIRRVDPDGLTHDYEAAFELDRVVVGSAPADDACGFYQHCIEAAILSFQPVWGRIITLGRKKFSQKLSRDEMQCFRVAGLLEDPPAIAVIGWWDRVAAYARLQGDQARLARARRAEQLSFEHEVNRIRKLGIAAAPVWMAIEDNTAGYDIQSFDRGASEPVARLIEVKSTILSPLRFRLTRNEWETAKKYGSSYHFHIWHLDDQGSTLHERTVADIQPHIPTDNERGRWENAEIPVIAAMAKSPEYPES